MNDIKNNKKQKKVLKASLYVIILLLVLFVVGSLMLTGLYFLLPFLKSYGDINNNQDKMNIVSICLTMMAFVFTYVLTILFMNLFFRVNSEQRFGVQNRLIIFDIIITLIIFCMVYVRFDDFRLFASSFFTIRYFPNSYVYITIPLILIPNLFMVFYVDRFMHFQVDLTDPKNVPNMNSSIIDDNKVKSEENVVWEEKAEKPDEIKDVKETIMEEEAKEPNEEDSIAIKTPEEMKIETEQKEVLAQKLEAKNTLDQVSATTSTGAQVFRGFDAPSVSSIMAQKTDIKNNDMQSDISINQTPQTTVSNNNPVYIPPEGTNPHQFDVINKTNLYPEKNPMPENIIHQTINYNDRFDTNERNDTNNTEPIVNESNYVNNVEPIVNESNDTDSIEPVVGNTVKPNVVETTQVENNIAVSPKLDSEEKTCPICGVHLKKDALVCFMCGHHF